MLLKGKIEIHGFKSFNFDCTNIHGMKFEKGKSYHDSGDIKFGTHGSGFHFCYRLEDTIRYSDYNGSNPLREVQIAKVIGSGIIDEGEDTYNEYFDMYAASDLFIERFLTREEIIQYALDLPEMRLKRFLSLYKLSENELIQFIGKYNCCDSIIEYYYLDNKDVSKFKTKSLNIINKMM